MDTKSLNLTSRRDLIIILTIITAFVHLFLSLSTQPIDIMFLLNFLGYLGLLAAFILPLPVFKNYHGLVRWAFMAFTLVTIVGWIIFGLRVWFAYPDKVIELVLVFLLWKEKGRGCYFSELNEPTLKNERN